MRAELGQLLLVLRHLLDHLAQVAHALAVALKEKSKQTKKTIIFMENRTRHCFFFFLWETECGTLKRERERETPDLYLLLLVELLQLLGHVLRHHRDVLRGEREREKERDC